MGDETSRPYRVLISYAHEPAEQVQLVTNFHRFLCDQGMDALFDKELASTPVNWALWFEQEIEKADFVLVLASPAYRRRAAETDSPTDSRGVRWEFGLIREALYRDPAAARAKFLSVLLPGAGQDDIPMAMHPYSGTHFRISDFTRDGAAKLLAVLGGRAVPAAPDPAHAVAEAAIRMRFALVGGSPWSRDVAIRAGVRRAFPAGRPVEVRPDADGGLTALIGVDRADLDLISSSLHELRNAMADLADGTLAATVVAGSTSSDGADGTLRLATHPSVRAMHEWPNAQLVVVLSEQLHDQRQDGREHFPDPGTFGRRELDGRAYWIAVDGYGTCPPEPGRRPTPDQPAAPERREPPVPGGIHIRQGKRGTVHFGDVYKFGDRR